MKCLILLAVLLGVASARNIAKRAAGDQNPPVWDALAKLRGKTLTVEQIQELYLTVVPGQDFPTLSEIPDHNIDCSIFKQPGFYANVDVGKCQVFDRCDINGNLTSYLCPNMTLFNQITLICDWWYNVDCSQERAFYDYSNSRLYQEGVVLLDNQAEIIIENSGAVQSRANGASAAVPVQAPKRKGHRHRPAAETAAAEQ